MCVCVCVKIQEKSINDEIYQFEKSQFPRENKERDVEMKARSKDQTGPTIIYEPCVYISSSRVVSFSKDTLRMINRS